MARQSRSARSFAATIPSAVGSGASSTPDCSRAVRRLSDRQRSIANRQVIRTSHARKLLRSRNCETGCRPSRGFLRDFLSILSVTDHAVRDPNRQSGRFAEPVLELPLEVGIERHERPERSAGGFMHQLLTRRRQLALGLGRLLPVVSGFRLRAKRFGGRASLGVGG